MCTDEGTFSSVHLNFYQFFSGTKLASKSRGKEEERAGRKSKLQFAPKCSLENVQHSLKFTVNECVQVMKNRENSGS